MARFAGAGSGRSIVGDSVSKTLEFVTNAPSSADIDAAATSGFRVVFQEATIAVNRAVTGEGGMAARGISFPGYMISFAGPLAYATFCAITILTYYFIPWRLLTVPPYQILIYGSLILAFTAVLAILLESARINSSVQAALSSVSRLPRGVSILAAIAVGVALRLLWVSYVPPVQYSDFAAYWKLAVQIVDTGRYAETLGGHELRAHRPIGLPLILAGGISMVGPSPRVPVAINLVAFVLSSLLIHDIARRIGSSTSGIIGVVLFALYPANIAMAGLAATEPLSICLYLAVGWALLTSAEGRLIQPALAGVLLGCAILVRPALLPAVLVVALFLVAVPRPLPHRITMLLVVMGGFSLIVGPWVLRNLTVFGEFVLVSTNGGNVFFNANNSLATGGYIAVVDRPLHEYLYDELLWNRTGYAWGIEWIRGHPAEFLKLALVKLGMLLANGAVPIEWTLKGTHGVTGPAYFVLYGIGHAWWILLWSIAGVALYRHCRDLATSWSAALLFSLMLVTPMVHAVFQSQPRHHSPMVGFVVVLATLALLPTTARLNDPWAKAEKQPAAKQPGRLHRNW